MYKHLTAIPKPTRLGVSCLKYRPFSQFAALKSDVASSKQEQDPSKHLDFLKQYYSPELLESIKITENIVTPEQRSQLRQPQKNSENFGLFYKDDLSTFDAYWDVSLDQDNNWIYHDRETPVDVPPGSELPTDTKFGGNRIGHELAKLTGLSEEYIDKLYVRPLIMKRVSNQTAKGKIPSFYALVVVGDKRGMIGIGEGKTRGGMKIAIKKAHWNAVKNMVKIPRHEDRTILSEINHKYHAVKLTLRSAPPGFGLRVNHFIFEICEACGIKDLSGKVYQSRNGMNIVKGVVEALSKQKTLEELALNRGKKIVDLRKTYYSQ